MKRLIASVLATSAIYAAAGAATANAAHHHHHGPRAHAAWVYIGDTGCELHSWMNVEDGSQDQYYGEGEVACQNNANLNIEVEIWQLVTGGWQEVGWTQVGPTSSTHYAFDQKTSTPFIRLTCGRWYNERTWGYVNGESRWYDTQSVQGSGSGCL